MNIIKFDYKFNGTPSLRISTKYIALHHAAADNCEPWDINAWHKNQGWSGIGYHFFVTKEGLVYEGRPITSIGAHCAGQNLYSLGVCCEGNYAKESEMPKEQMHALEELLAYLKSKYPNAELVGHRDIGASTCPGAYFPLDYFKQLWKGDLAMAQMSYVELKQKFDTLQKQMQRLMDAQDVIYHYTQSVPDWGRPTVQKLLDKGLYKGASDSDLNLPETLLRVLVINDRAGLYD